MSRAETRKIEELANKEYKFGFVTDIEADTLPKGLNEDITRQLSTKKQKPEWLTEWRLNAYRHRLTMEEPKWLNVKYTLVDYQELSYYSAPKSTPKYKRRNGFGSRLYQHQKHMNIAFAKYSKIDANDFEDIYKAVVLVKDQFTSC